MRRWLASPSVQAVIEGKRLAIAQLLVPKKFRCKGKEGRKLKTKNLAFLLKAQFTGFDQAKGTPSPLPLTDPTHTRRHKVYWLRSPRCYEGILMA